MCLGETTSLKFKYGCSISLYNKVHVDNIFKTFLDDFQFSFTNFCKPRKDCTALLIAAFKCVCRK